MLLSYANGKYIPTSKLTLPVAADTIGTFRGYRIFTACRTLGDQVFRLDDHVSRLLNSARQIKMELPFSRKQLKTVIEQVAVRNRRQNKTGDFLLEIMFSGGQAAVNGVAPAGKAVLYIVVFPVKMPPDRWYSQGIKLASYPYQRQWPEVKLLNYVGGVIAHQTVVKQFKADEALFVTPDRRQVILEGTTFNFFVVKWGKIITHPLNGKILPGITRKVALQLAQKLRIPVQESLFLYRGLDSVDEAFVTSSTRNVVPVAKVDGIQIGNGQPGEITLRLGEAFRAYQEKITNF